MAPKSTRLNGRIKLAIVAAMLSGVACAIGILQLLVWLLLLAASAHLLRLARWGFSHPFSREVAPLPGGGLPRVTVQLPLRNERAVAERVIRKSVALDWPRDRLEIQVLDDSDDDTSALVDRTVAGLAAAGHDIRVHRRADRRGFKAGNLASGLASARGEFILVLDADSQPAPDLLRRLMLPLLENPRLGFVQARWTFENERENLLTRVQAMILTGLFSIEQARLSARAEPLQFNGTSGIWRREALERAGGWLAAGEASITEDLDLSYRAKLAGYGGVTLADVTVETELPASMAAFRTQQQRWVEGAAAGLVPLGKRVLGKTATRGEALSMLAHLARHSRQPLLLALALWLPFTLTGAIAPRFALPHAWPAVVVLVLASVVAYYTAAFRRTRMRPDHALGRAALLATPLLALSIGLSWALTVAFLRGLLFPTRARFVRTPKRGREQAIPTRRSIAPIEALLGCVYLLVAALLLARRDAAAATGALLFAAGFLWIGVGR